MISPAIERKLEAMEKWVERLHAENPSKAIKLLDACASQLIGGCQLGVYFATKDESVLDEDEELLEELRENLKTYLDED